MDVNRIFGHKVLISRPTLRWAGLFIFYKVAVLALAWIGLATFTKIWPLSASHFVSLLFEWDAKIMLDVARNGYTAGPHSNLQVFPLFPFFVRLVHFFLRDWNFAAFMAAQIGSFFSFYYFYKIARLDLSERDAEVALALFALFPTAYFLTAPYSETVFCAASFSLVYYSRIGRPRIAAVAGFATALSRVTAILFIPALLAHAYEQRRKLAKTRGSGRFDFALPLLTLGLGFAVYLVINKIVQGDWFFYARHQATNWGVHVAWPFQGAVGAIAAWPARPADQKMTIIVLELAFTFVAIALLPIVAKRRPLLDSVYAGLTLLLLVSMDFWLSRPRYVMPLYPFFMAVAHFFARSVLRFAVYAVLSMGIFGVYWALYLSAQWAH